ncbi:MAG: hypothetical protein FWD66_03410 [Paludibacter sp.]|nr:hypothetical protein [Paludibacter sp.]
MSGQKNDNYSIVVEGSSGYVLLPKTLAKDYSYGFSAELEWQTTGKHAWEHYLNFPSIGTGFRFMTLGNHEMLGNLFAVYPYLRFPLLRSQLIKVDMQTGAGLAFVTKRYSNTPHIDDDPNKIVAGMNGVIGTLVNAYFTVGFGAEVPIKNGWSIRANINGNHASNGNMGLPNNGVNIANALVGLKFSPNWEKNFRPKSIEKIPDLPRKIQYEITLSGGMVNLHYTTGKMYPMGSLAFAAYKPLSNWYSMGFGADVFYDGIYSFVNYPWKPYQNVRAAIRENDLKNLFRVGISWQHQILIGRFTAGLHAGVYFYDNIKNHQPYIDVFYRYQNGEGDLHRPIFYNYKVSYQDGWCYGRAIGKYRFSKHWLVSVGVKSHLLRADFIEWGLGYHF